MNELIEAFKEWWRRNVIDDDPWPERSHLDREDGV